MIDHLIDLIPPHRIYVEAFGGGAALLLNKPPSPVEVYNDINKDLVNFFRVLKDPNKFERLHRYLSLTPHSREEHRYAKENYLSGDEIERAALFWIATHQSLNGITGGTWSRTTWQSRRGMALKTSAWLGVIEGIAGGSGATVKGNDRVFGLPEAHRGLRHRGDLLLFGPAVPSRHAGSERYVPTRDVSGGPCQAIRNHPSCQGQGAVKRLPQQTL
jgi:hypothetical protein